MGPTSPLCQNGLRSGIYGSRSTTVVELRTTHPETDRRLSLALLYESRVNWAPPDRDENARLGACDANAIPAVHFIRGDVDLPSEDELACSLGPRACLVPLRRKPRSGAIARGRAGWRDVAVAVGVAEVTATFLPEKPDR